MDAETLRLRVVCHQRNNRDDFAPYVVGDFDEYLERRLAPRIEWGAELELSAAADVVEHHIIVWRDGQVIGRYGRREHPEIHLRYSGPTDQGHYDLYLVPPRSASPQPTPAPREA